MIPFAITSYFFIRYQMGKKLDVEAGTAVSISISISFFLFVLQITETPAHPPLSKDKET